MLHVPLSVLVSMHEGEAAFEGCGLASCSHHAELHGVVRVRVSMVLLDDVVGRVVRVLGCLLLLVLMNHGSSRGVAVGRELGDLVLAGPVHAVEVPEAVLVEHADHAHAFGRRLEADGRHVQLRLGPCQDHALVRRDDGVRSLHRALGTGALRASANQTGCVAVAAVALLLLLELLA